jgi:hypothetical protein|nr:MAG TPA: hypothetical protein [Caudoviricetes sp.]
MTKISQISNSQIILEEVEFLFARNFTGRQEKFNRAGDRYFNVKVEPEDVELLQQYGVNVKLYEPKNITDEMAEKMAENPDMFAPSYFFKVRVYTQFGLPSIAIIYDNGDTPIDEEILPTDRMYLNDESQLAMLDDMEIALCDMTIARRDPSPDGQYARLNLKNAYIRVVDNPLRRKYGF